MVLEVCMTLVKLERRDTVAVLTLNRPEALNARSSAMLAALCDAAGEVATDAELASVRTVTIGIDDAALLLDGMAFTEVASAELPWVEMVRWTSDFITAELRQHWTDDEWRALAGS